MQRWKAISQRDLDELLEAELRACRPPERASPGGKGVRAAICALYPKPDTDPFDEIINFTELFIKAGGTESAATETLKNVSVLSRAGT